MNKYLKECFDKSILDYYDGSEEEIENILSWNGYEDSFSNELVGRKKWLKSEFPELSEKELKKVNSFISKENREKKKKEEDKK